MRGMPNPQKKIATAEVKKWKTNGPYSEEYD